MCITHKHTGNVFFLCSEIHTHTHEHTHAHKHTQAHIYTHICTHTANAHIHRYCQDANTCNDVSCQRTNITQCPKVKLCDVMTDCGECTDAKCIWCQNSEIESAHMYICDVLGCRYERYKYTHTLENTRKRTHTHTYTHTHTHTHTHVPTGICVDPSLMCITENVCEYCVSVCM